MYWTAVQECKPQVFIESDDLTITICDCCIERLHKISLYCELSGNLVFQSQRWEKSTATKSWEPRPSSRRCTWNPNMLNPFLKGRSKNLCPNVNVSVTTFFNYHQRRPYLCPQGMNMRHLFWPKAQVLIWAQCVEKIFHWYFYSLIHTYTHPLLTT